MTALTQTLFAGTSLSARIANLRTQLADAAAKRKVYRTTLAELESLSPRDLADLGMSPTSIKDIAYEAAYGA